MAETPNPKVIAPMRHKSVQRVAESHLETLEPSTLDKIASITHLKKRKFIQIFYACSGNVSKACQAVQIGRRTYYDWLNKDPLFNELIAEQFNQVLDEASSKLISTALDGNDKTSLTANIFLLKTRHPDYKAPDNTLAYENAKEGVRFVLTRG